MKNIFRIERRTNPFAQIDRSIFENAKLSWKAKGLIGYLLSRPENWIVCMEDLINRSMDGETSVRSAMNELRAHGYVRLEKVRGDEGKLNGARWVVREDPGAPWKPQEDEVGVQTELTDIQVSRMPEKPRADNPPAENRALSNKEGSNKNLSPDELREESRAFVEWFKAELIRTGVKKLLITPGIENGWADAYEKMIRIDGRTKEEIVRVCRWARRNDFWAANFLSPAKLRQKDKSLTLYFDVFVQRMTHDEKTPRTTSRALGDNSNLEAFAEFDRQQRLASQT